VGVAVVAIVGKSVGASSGLPVVGWLDKRCVMDGTISCPTALSSVGSKNGVSISLALFVGCAVGFEELVVAPVLEVE